jgi:hypothetical protein
MEDPELSPGLQFEADLKKKKKLTKKEMRIKKKKN